MAILGVLLGMVICGLALAGYELSECRKDFSAVAEDLEDFDRRITILERRKTVIAEAVAAQPKPKGVVNRAWKEDAEAAD